MSHILHYLEIKGTREYIVITDENDTKETRQDYCLSGYQFNASYEIEKTGILPTERPLSPD